MDNPITRTPELDQKLSYLVEKADIAYRENFGDITWFGRCIFLSWYCERGTCDFCFRSTQKHRIKHPKDARRSLPSIFSEAALIRGLGWKMEFLTGGYGVYPFDDIVRIAKVCSEIIGKKIWINLGELQEDELKKLKPYVEGIVCSLETLEPELHDKVCPDKPIEPYLKMAETARELGFRLSFTLIIGLGEKHEDFNYVKEIIKDYKFDRITIYALRPVAGTPYNHGPAPEDLAWWIAQARINFPAIEIIAGTAIYRIPEISLLLRAGANAFTKLPATDMFNKKEAELVEQEVKKAKRRFISSLTSKEVLSHCDWFSLIDNTSLSKKEKEDTYRVLNSYLERMERNLKGQK